jgi:hypothetical protein
LASRPSTRGFCLAALVLVIRSVTAHAQQVPIDPASTHIFPAGGRPGTTVDVRIGGECLPPGAGLRTWGEGINAPATLGPRASANYEPSPRRNPRETPMAYPKEWQASITIAPDAPLGQKLWRVTSGRGGTAARPFIVGELPEIVETESNSSPAKAERVTLPVTINGQIAGERDTDYFGFSAEKGEVITAEVAAARLGSPLETLIEFHDTSGHRLAARQLRAGSDPVLVLEVPAAGEYRVFVANLSFRGGPAFVYRMTLTRLPYVRWAFPPRVRAGQTADLDIFREYGSGSLTQSRESVSIPEALGESCFATPTPSANRIALVTAETPVVVESEPNDAPAQASDLALDVAVCGRLGTAVDEDWFILKAQKGQLYALDCQPLPKTSPALPVLSVIKSDGQKLATAKSVEALDGKCALDWRAPEDGVYFLRVADTQQGAAGGVDYTYSLLARHGQADFALASKTDFVNLVQGGRAELEVTIARRGELAAPTDLAVEGLPEGVRFEPRQIPTDQNLLKIAFVAGDDVRPAAHPLKLIGSAVVDGQKMARSLVATHLGHDADGIGLGPSSVDHIHLTVAHKPVFKLACSEAYQYAHRGTVYPYLMEVERVGDFAGPIQLEVADRQIKDLDGIEVREMTLAPGETKFMLRLFLPETMHINLQAHSNVYAQGHVSFTDKWGQPQSHLVVSTMRCMVRTLPPVVKLQAVDRDISAKPGQTVTCRMELIRTPNFTGPMRIELADTSASSLCSAEPATIEANQATATLAVRISPAAVAGPDALLTFRATGDMPGDVQVVSEASMKLHFQ